MYEHYIIPTLIDLSERFKSAKIFSVLNLKDGFWQIRQGKSSAILCAFSTIFGVFCFNKLPFEIKNATEIYQRRNIELFRQITNVFLYLDDILVFGDNEKQHDCALRYVFDKAMENNITFNKAKVHFKVEHVK